MDKVYKIFGPMFLLSIGFCFPIGVSNNYSILRRVEK